jgi:hypothetical protein
MSWARATAVKPWGGGGRAGQADELKQVLARSVGGAAPASRQPRGPGREAPPRGPPARTRTRDEGGRDCSKLLARARALGDGADQQPRDGGRDGAAAVG